MPPANPNKQIRTLGCLELPVEPEAVGHTRCLLEHSGWLLERVYEYFERIRVKQCHRRIRTSKYEPLVALSSQWNQRLLAIHVASWSIRVGSLSESTNILNGFELNNASGESEQANTNPWL